MNELAAAVHFLLVLRSVPCPGCLPVHQLMDTGYFQFWRVRNNTARNTGEYNYFFLFLPRLPPPPPLPAARSLLCKYRGAVERLGHVGGTYLTFKEAIRLDSSGFPCLYSDH